MGFWNAQNPFLSSFFSRLTVSNHLRSRREPCRPPPRRWALETTIAPFSHLRTTAVQAILRTTEGSSLPAVHLHGNPDFLLPPSPPPPRTIVEAAHRPPSFLPHWSTTVRHNSSFSRRARACVVLAAPLGFATVQSLVLHSPQWKVLRSVEGALLSGSHCRRCFCKPPISSSQSLWSKEVASSSS